MPNHWESKGHNQELQDWVRQRDGDHFEPPVVLLLSKFQGDYHQIDTDPQNQSRKSFSNHLSSSVYVNFGECNPQLGQTFWANPMLQKGGHPFGATCSHSPTPTFGRPGWIFQRFLCPSCVMLILLCFETLEMDGNATLVNMNIMKTMVFMVLINPYLTPV